MQYCIFFNCKIVLNTFLLIDLSDTEKSTEKKKTLQTSVCLIRSEN